MVRRRRFLTGAAPAAFVSVSGCLDGVFGLSEEEQELLEQYKEAYDHHEDGLEFYDGAFTVYDDDDLDRAEIRFEDAESAYADADNAYGLDQVELVSEVFEGDSPLVHEEATSAITRGATAAGFILVEIDSLQMDHTVDSSKRIIQGHRQDYEAGDFEMPSVDHFEDAL